MVSEISGKSDADVMINRSWMFFKSRDLFFVGVGRKLKYAVEKGQLLSHWDFEPIPRKAIAWAKSISKNQIVTEKHLKHVWIEDDPVPHKDLFGMESFIGKQVKKNVQAETFLRMDQFSE